MIANYPMHGDPARLHGPPVARHRARRSSTKRATRCRRARRATSRCARAGRRCSAPTGTTRSCYNSRFKNGWYITGDRARMDADGYFWFVGRADDVINTAGHLVGPFEVESALIEHPAVAEAGVIGKPDPVAMEIVKAFVALKDGFEPTEKLRRELIRLRAREARRRRRPARDRLPRRRCRRRARGKIMRRLLKARELGLPEGDTSTLED